MPGVTQLAPPVHPLFTAEVVTPPGDSDENCERELQWKPGRVKNMIALFSNMCQGSDPSISSTNGRQSAMTVSKRTLTSHDNITTSHDHDPASRLTDVAMDSDANHPQKMPSYVKLSCSVSGYNKYSTYVADRDTRGSKPIRKTSDKNDTHCEQNGCCPPAMANGHTPVDTENRTQPITHKHRSRGSQSDTDNVIQNGSGPVRDGSSDHVTVIDRTVSQSVDEVDRSVPRRDLHLYGDDKGEKVPSLDLSHGAEEKSSPCNGVDPDEDIPTPNKDGNYFMGVMDRETQRLKSLCEPAEDDLNQDLSEEACGKLRAAIGKANLLINKKFKQFRGLCEKNINQVEDDPFLTTNEDLAGFWDMVYIQVEDVTGLFQEIDLYRKNNWNSPLRQKAQVKSAGSSGGRSPRSKVSRPLSGGEKSKKKKVPTATLR